MRRPSRVRDDMAQASTRLRGQLPRQLRWLIGPVEKLLACLTGTDLNVVAMTAAIVMLCGISMLAIYMAMADSADLMSKMQHQGTWVIAALAALVVVSMIDYRRWGDIAYPAFAGTLVLLAMLVIAKKLNFSTSLIHEKNGAWRWIDIGTIGIQPSEFAKITYILALAWYLRYRRNYRTLGGMIWPLSMTLLPMVLILLEPDLGTVMLLLPVFFGMLLVAGAKRRHLLSLVSICVLAAPVLYSTMHQYQRMRIMGAVLQSGAIRNYLVEHPRALAVLQITSRQIKQWERREGYQLDHSKVAIASGGLVGSNNPDYDCTQYGYLPERHNDFIFAVIGHKWGWIGCLMVIGCYSMIVVGGCHISTATNEPFGRLLAIGVVMLIATQATVNIGMAIGLLPVTGVTLPFVSYGGSSLLANGALVGILLNIGLRKTIVLAPEPFIFERREDEE